MYKKTKVSFKNLNLNILKLLVFTLGSFLILLPWRILIYLKINPGSLNWTYYGNVWSARWRTDQYFIDLGLGPWVNGGINFACKLDPIKCEKIQYRELIFGNKSYTGEGYLTEREFFTEFLDSLFSNPLTFLFQRASTIYQHWLTNNQFNYLEVQSKFEAIIY